LISKLDDLYNWLILYLKLIPEENDEATAVYDYLSQSYFIYDQPSLFALQNEVCSVL
jgi:hypothetical protein